MRKLYSVEGKNSGIKFSRGDICKLEIQNNGCITTSIALVLSRTKRYVTYLCINSLETDPINDEFNIPITKKDFEELNSGYLFEFTKYIHVVVNQIKTNKSLIISEVLGKLNNDILDKINIKLYGYLSINETSLKDENDAFQNINLNGSLKHRIKLSDSEKLDLINNYHPSKKEYYSDKYDIPINKIAQKVSTLRYQHKKKLLENNE